MDQVTQALLAQLRDIHEPTPPSWFPPAPGWWLLAILGGFLLLSLIRFFLKKRAIKHRKQLAFNEMEMIKNQLNNHPNAWGHQRLSELIKRLAIESFPNIQIPSLSPEKWLAFLEQTSPNNSSDAAWKIMESQRVSYQKNAPVANEELFIACNAWISKNYPCHD